MASALQLNAQATIINGLGLGASPDLTTTITSYQNLATVKLVKEIFTAIKVSTAPTSLYSIIAGINTGVTSASFLIDFYPTGNTAVCSGNVSYYGNIATPVYVGGGENPVVDHYEYSGQAGTASVSNTVLVQAGLPFAHGLSGFANVYMTSYGAANQSFETVSSINILKDKTYSQSGIGFTGPVALATGGIGANGALLADVVAGWGTMYDIKHLSNFADPYVFGQYLLSQGLGKYKLTTLFLEAGLNLGDLSNPPSSTTISYHQSNTATATTYVGSIELPITENVTISTPVTASSPDVMHGIYKKVVDSNLSSIVSSTKFTALDGIAVGLKTLDDYLTLSKVIDNTLLTRLSAIGVTDFSSLGTYFHKILGQATFESWATMAKFLRSIEVPVLSSNTVPGATTTVLTANTIATLNSNSVTGSGSIGHATVKDFLGACAGIPYTSGFRTIVTNYTGVATTGLVSALTTLKSAVTSYISAGPVLNGDGSTYTWPDPSGISTAVSAVNAVLTSFPNSASFYSSTISYNNMIVQMATEVANLTKGNVIFGAGQTSTLKSLAEQIGTMAADKTQFEAYQFFSNIITKNEAGDTIRSAIAESINSTILQGAGIQISNDPQPAQAIQRADSLGVPISTYLSQNK
jgi:hypothetical protein